MKEIPFDNFAVVFGWDQFSNMIVKQLLNSSNKVAALVRDEETRLWTEDTFGGENFSVNVVSPSDYSKMKKIGIGNSQNIFVNLGDDQENLTTILRMQNHFPKAEYMVALNDEELEDTFRSAGVTYAVSKFSISSKIVGSFLYEPDVATYTEDLLTATETDQDYDIQQYRVTENCDGSGATFRELLSRIRSDYGAVAIGLRKKNGPLLKVPDPNAEVSEGDYVLLATQGSGESGLENFFGTQEGVLNGEHT